MRILEQNFRRYKTRIFNAVNVNFCRKDIRRRLCGQVLSRSNFSHRFDTSNSLHQHFSLFSQKMSPPCLGELILFLCSSLHVIAEPGTGFFCFIPISSGDQSFLEFCFLERSNSISNNAPNAVHINHIIVVESSKVFGEVACRIRCLFTIVPEISV